METVVGMGMALACGEASNPGCNQEMKDLA